MPRLTAVNKATRLVVLTDGDRTVVIGQHAAYDITDATCICVASAYGSTCSHRIAARTRSARQVPANVLDLLLGNRHDRRRVLAALARLLAGAELERVIAFATDAVLAAEQIGGAA